MNTHICFIRRCLFGILFAFVSVSVIQAQSRAEYFFDTDPGFGKGTKVTVPIVSGNINFSASTAGLEPGAHLMGVRVMTNNHWSPTLTKMVVVPHAGTLGLIHRVEYFWDTDPGYGKATEIAITPGTVVDLTDFRISTEGMTGSHLLGIRALADGRWTPTMFYEYSTEGRSMNTADLTALRNLYNNFDGANWNGDVWNPTSELIKGGNWSGVSFDSDGRVTAIDLQGRGLSGAMSSSTAIDLPLLTTLNLKENALTGDPTKFLEQATQLATVNLSYNQIDNMSGALSPAITTLDLSAQHRSSQTYVRPGLDDMTAPVLNIGGATSIDELPNIYSYNHLSQNFSNHEPLHLVHPTNYNYNYGRLIWSAGNNCYQFTSYGWLMSAKQDGIVVIEPANTSIARQSACRATLHFTPGDANLNGVVDVNDVQRTLNYVLDTNNNTTTTFGLWAANTYTTGEDPNTAVINIQDIVATVNIMMDSNNNSPAPRQRVSAVDDTAANLFYTAGHTVMLDAQDGVAAFDLQIDGVSASQVEFLLDTNRWAMMTRNNAQGVRIVVFSMLGDVLPTGLTRLFNLKAEGMIARVQASGAVANNLSAGVAGGTTGITQMNSDNQGLDLTMEAGGLLTINAAVAQGRCQIRICNVAGQLLMRRTLDVLPVGSTTLDTGLKTLPRVCIVTVETDNIQMTRKLIKR